MSMIHNRISSDIKDLNELHKKYWWIPDETMIRPCPKDLDDKEHFSIYILHNWMSFKDFILHKYFNYTIDVEDGHIYIANNVQKSEWKFTSSIFPYNLPENVNHYILWNSFYDYFTEFDDSIINTIIKDNLKNILGNDEFDFAWYKNPKPSIPELYHVQVFWIKI